MTVVGAIAHLEKILKEKGDLEVVFDCPRCDHSFAPNKVVTVAVHLKGDMPKEPTDGK